MVEDIYYRGEWVGSKRKYDTCLLLAHLARLDRLVKPEAEPDADRFDELPAVIIGEPIPAGLEGDDEYLAIDRERFAEQAARAARIEAEERDRPSDEGGDDALSAEERWARDEARAAEHAAVEHYTRAEARSQWDEWHGEICAAVDAALDPALEDDAGEPDDAEQPVRPVDETAPGNEADVSLRTPSTVSTPSRRPGERRDLVPPGRSSPNEIPACAGTTSGADEGAPATDAEAAAAALRGDRQVFPQDTVNSVNTPSSRRTPGPRAAGPNLDARDPGLRRDDAEAGKDASRGDG